MRGTRLIGTLLIATAFVSALLPFRARARSRRRAAPGRPGGPRALPGHDHELLTTAIRGLLLRAPTRCAVSPAATSVGSARGRRPCAQSHARLATGIGTWSKERSSSAAHRQHAGGAQLAPIMRADYCLDPRRGRCHGLAAYSRACAVTHRFDASPGPQAGPAQQVFPPPRPTMFRRRHATAA